MFTGIIEEVGEVLANEQRGDGARLLVRASSILGDLSVGGSVAVNGCCLTAISVESDRVAFDLARETLARTGFGLRLRPSVRVNLELPLRMSSRLDGHVVQGHVDGVATVVKIHDAAGSCEVMFEVPDGLAKYCVEKGSIALDGVSLTCAAVVQTRVTVALVPHTLAMTTLSALRLYDPVNIEVDIVAKYVERLIAK